MRISKRRMLSGVPAISEDGKEYFQLEVFPSRLLNLDTAQRLIDELNMIKGITRMIVYGPRIPPDDVDDLLNGRFEQKEKKYLNILGERVELLVHVGRIWIEVEDLAVRDKINSACEKVLPFSFEMNEGMYLRTRKTVTDYLKTGGDVDHISLGMFDPNAKKPACRGERKEKQNGQHGTSDAEGYI